MVAIDTVTEAGSRWVTTKVASGNVDTSGPNCSRCWGDLSTHRVTAPQPLQHLEDGAQVLVGRGLVLRLEVVAPRRQQRLGLEQHGRDVDGQELDLLVHVVDGHLVHPVEVGQGLR